MSADVLRNKAQLAGFSKLLGSDSSQFVLLSNKTDGRNGKRIFIDSHLAPKFALLVEKEQENHIMEQLFQLRAVAGAGQAYSNMANAFEHMHVFQHLKVSYKIIQFSGGRDEAGVYITDLDLCDFEKGNMLGLFQVACTDNQWYLIEKPKKRISTKNVAINGLSENACQAATKIMPELIESAYGNREGIGVIRNEGYSLFYNPQSTISGGKTWKTPEQKLLNQNHVAALLGNYLLNTPKSSEGRKTQWTIHGNGAVVFGKAIKRLAGKDLSQHEVIFLSPPDEANMSTILADMRQAKIGLHEAVMKVNADDWSGMLNRTKRSVSISDEIRQFGSNYSVKADEIVSRGIADGMQAFSWIKFGVTLGLSPLIKIKHIRNMAAQRLDITDEAVNPHFHPFKDSHQFNVHAKTASGNKVNQIIFLELVNKIRRR